MYTQKIQEFILEGLSKTYKDVDVNKINNDGPIVQKSPDTIKSDFGSSLPLRLAKSLKKPPLQIANNLNKFLNDNKPLFLDEITVVNPGYINFSINNVDINIIAQKPKIKKYSKKIVKKISEICEINPNQINIKGKTTEKLGIIGKGRAIASEVITSIIKND